MKRRLRLLRDGISEETGQPVFSAQSYNGTNLYP